jgi:hypothetical protein
LIVIIVLILFWLRVQYDRISRDIAAGYTLDLQWKYLILVLVLVPFNWIFESIKWKLLTQKYQDITIRRSLQTVLSGVALGTITPARIGEYGGRIISSTSMKMAHTTWATWIGSLAQNFWNIAVGLMISISLIHTHFKLMDEFSYLSFLVYAQLMILIVIYLYAERFVRWFSRLFLSTRLRRFFKNFYDIDDYTFLDKLYVLLLSFLRYWTYFLQYYLTLKFVNIHIDFSVASVTIAAIYCIQSLIPLPGSLSIVARGELAVWMWSQHQAPATTALVATFSLWMTNVIIPGLIGLYFLIKSDLWFIKKE